VPNDAVSLSAQSLFDNQSQLNRTEHSREVIKERTRKVLGHVIGASVGYDSQCMRAMDLDERICHNGESSPFPPSRLEWTEAV
jgi:hypothetical protein